MEYVFPYDEENMAFGPVTVRARAKLRFGDEPVKLKPRTEVEVMSESGYAEKVSITDSELIQNGTAHRFVVELQQAFTLQAYRELILGQQPLSVRVTLFPDVSLPLPTAGVPVPDTTLPVAETVGVAIPKATIGRIEVVLDSDSTPDDRNFYVKARVHLPQVIADRPSLERQYTDRCRFSPQTERLQVVRTEPAGEWVRAHLTLAPNQDLTRTEPEIVAVTVRAEIEDLVLEGKVQITVHPVRQLALVVSDPYVRTSLDQSVTLTIKAVDVLPDGSRVLADDAEISIAVQEGLADVVRVTPHRGRGELGTGIRQTTLAKVASGELLVQAQVEQGAVKDRLPLYVTSGKYVLTWQRLARREDAPSDAPWSIYWDPARLAWRCEPIRLKLGWGVEGRMEPRIIEDVHMEDLEEWLEIERLLNEREEGCVVYLRMKPSKVAELVPSVTEDPTICAVDPLPEPRPPWRVLETAVTLSAMVKGETDAAASVEIPCAVEPPKITWRAFQRESLRLSGQSEQVDLRIDSGELPRGWDQGLEVFVAFADPDKAQRMEISLGQLTLHRGLTDALDLGHVPPAEVADATLDVSPSAGDLDQRVEAQLGRLRGVIQVASRLQCFKKLKALPAVLVPEDLDLYVVLQSPHRGVTPPQQVAVRIQPQLIALYLGAYPYEQYPWHEPKHQVQAVRSDLAAPMAWSQVTLSLRYLQGWPDAPVRWLFADNDSSLDDRFVPDKGVRTTYTGPSQASWENNNQTELRSFHCVVGPDDDQVYADEPTGILTTARFSASIVLREPLGKAKLRVIVKPKNFPVSPDKMMLRDRGVYDSFVRTFSVEVDLQFTAAPEERRR